MLVNDHLFNFQTISYTSRRPITRYLGFKIQDITMETKVVFVRNTFIHTTFVPESAVYY